MTEKTTKRLVLDLEDAAVSLVGRTLSGRYVLESVLGQGGMGTVYSARHQVIGRRYAVKVLRREIASDHDTVLRFIQEAKIAGGLASPNVVEVLDFGEVSPDAHNTFSAPFMVMPLLEGRTFADILEKEGPIDGARAAGLFAQAADGLAAAHDKSVVHRDLKPDNLFVLREGDHELVKVLDFGVAKLLKAPKLTKHGTVFGTPYYMSPEQAGGRDVDPRTDQYALGVVMYEVLSGRVPFDDDTPMGVMTKHLFATPEPLEAVVRDPSRLGRMAPIVMRCLEKRRENRFSDMRELAAALRSAERVAPAPASSSVAMAVTTPRGTVRMPDAPSRGVARTELDLSSKLAAPIAVESKGRVVVVALAVGLLVAATAVSVAYWAYVRPAGSDGAKPSSATASAPPPPGSPEPSPQSPPSPGLASALDAGAAPPPGGHSAAAAAASTSPAPTFRTPPGRASSASRPVPLPSSTIDPHVW